MTVLTPELLARIRDRAAGYDRDNTFFTEDLAELRAAGYLGPRSLLETARDQRLLAAYAPATALGINMHLVWVGVARVLAERGDSSLDWVLHRPLVLEQVVTGPAVLPAAVLMIIAALAAPVLTVTGVVVAVAVLTAVAVAVTLLRQRARGIRTESRRSESGTTPSHSPG